MKKRRRWGLMGLMGLGGLLMMGAGGRPPKEDEPDDGGSGSGGGPGGGSGSGGSGGSGGGGDPGSGGDDENPYGDLPPPPPVFPDDPEDEPDPPKPPGSGPKPRPGTGDPIPAPKPTPGHKPKPRPGTGDPIPAPKPPITTPADDGPPQPDPYPDPELGPSWSELLDPYPRGGAFYPVVEGDRFGGTSSTHSIAYRYLLSEAYLAAVEEGGLDPEDATAWALVVAKQDKLRLKVIDLIQCSGWNDAMYGAAPVQISHASKHGRSILLRPAHGPTAEQLEEGVAPVRNITLSGYAADDDLQDYELLWMPAIDRLVLWESGGQAITTTGMQWDDGTSMENPPPWVMALGVEDLSGALTGDFGCPGSDGELEVE